jgi:predicted RNase H-like HicB family nuclease
LLGMERTFDVVVTEDEDGWFVAEVPALRGCLTQGETREEALENIKEAILLCLNDPAEVGVRSVSVASVSIEA